MALPRDFRANAWEGLLLDAETRLPDVVSAIVLSAVALEVLIGNSLAALLRSAVFPQEPTPTPDR